MRRSLKRRLNMQIWPSDRYYYVKIFSPKALGFSRRACGNSGSIFNRRRECASPFLWPALRSRECRRPIRVPNQMQASAVAHVCCSPETPFLVANQILRHRTGPKMDRCKCWIRAEVHETLEVAVDELSDGLRRRGQELRASGSTMNASQDGEMRRHSGRELRADPSCRRNCLPLAPGH